MNIILIGMRGSGKTTIGMLLSQKLGIPLIETDVLVENDVHFPITTLIQRYGWDYFRDLESKIVSKLAPLAPCVVSTGGGIILREENIRTLKHLGIVVWLKAGIDTMESRLREGKNRPALTNNVSLREEIIQVAKQRQAPYKAASDYEIETDHKRPSQIVEDILKRIYI